jgi:ABC-type amino acid transport substrate-binding protein
MRVFVLGLLAAALFVFPAMTQEKGETTFARVMRTQTIRCGYGVWNPLIIKDPNTGALSGIFYDYLETLGKELHLKIEWNDNLTWSDWIIGLNSGRYDAACMGIWPLASNARSVDFTIPLFYHAMYAYARADDARFDKSLDAANNKDITFVGQDGAIQQALVPLMFPNAKLLSVPDIAAQTDVFLNVADKKADILIADKITAESFSAANPGKIKQVPGAPLAHYANTIGVKTGDDDFRRMLDNATRDLMNRGVIDAILKKYEKYPDSFIRAARPYQTSD